MNPSGKSVTASAKARALQWLALAIPALLWPILTTAAAAQPTAAQISKQSMELLRSEIDAGAPGAAVLIARGDQVLFRAARGLANVELESALSPDQIFLIGSNTKLFTAATILKFVEAGKLSLDDPLSGFLPDYPGGSQVTIHQLLNHTSGIKDFTTLPSSNSEQREYTTQGLIDLFRNAPADFAPGTDWRYDNSGYVLLAAILEKISGQTWHEVVRQTLIEPLKLTYTGYSQVQPIVRGRVAGYSRDQQGAVINVESGNTSGASAAGALASSLDDMLRWLRALHTGRVLTPESYRSLVTPMPSLSGSSTSYGYGIINFVLRGQPGLWHSGNIGGFASAQAYFPGPAITVIVLSNTDTAPPDPSLLMQKLAAIAMGRPFPVRKPMAATLAELRKLEGFYRVDEKTLRRLSVADGRLVMQRDDGPPRELLTASPDELYQADRIAWFRVVRDASGQAAALDLYDGSDAPPKRERRESEVPDPSPESTP